MNLGKSGKGTKNEKTENGLNIVGRLIVFISEITPPGGL
jgi:hypothetical protein